MATLWPWLAIAGLGAFHGLSPASGWLFAAGWGVQARNRAQVWRALVPIGFGHIASVAVVAAAVAQGLTLDRALVRGMAGALLVAAAAYRMLHRARPQPPAAVRTGHAGIALWSFLMATAHGAGLMLVPALAPLCLADNPARAITASGSLGLALAAVGVHTSAMLATTGLVASGACRAVALQPRLLSGSGPRRAWTLVLAVTGVALMVWR